MGFRLKLNLFRDVQPEWVYRCYADFYARKGRPLSETGDEHFDHTLHDVNGGWTIVSEGAGWDWQERREAQQFASAALGCPSLRVFAYDGDYWGYELLDAGKALDQFVQDPDPCDGTDWFPGRPTAGNAEIFACQFPWLTDADVAPYLVRQVNSAGFPGPDRPAQIAAWEAEHNRLNVKPRPGDEFPRFDSLAVLDFLRLLNVGIDLLNGCATLATPALYRYWIPPVRRGRRNRARG